MASQSQPETHVVLLAIAAAAFIVLFVLGISLYMQQSEHLTAERKSSHTPENTH